jgi:peptide/nickel transport system substrate-binding protein
MGCSSSREPVSKDTLRIALSSAPATLDPRKATDATGMRLCNVIFQSLVRVSGSLEVEGEAASAWSYKDKTYRFTLKPDLRFQNGRSVTAEDVLFSFKEFQSKKSPFSSAFAPIQKVQVRHEKDHLVVLVHVDDYSAKFLSSDLPVLKILPEKETLEAQNFGERPLGSGPLAVEAFDLQKIILKRQPPANDGRFNRFEFKVIHDDFTRSQKILKGEVDVAIAELPPEIVRRLQDREKEKVQVLTYPGLSMTYLLVNLNDPKLKDLSVRKALSQAVNRQEIISYKLMHLGEEATSLLTPNNPYYNADLKNPPFDPKSAEKILSGLGTLSLKTSSNPTAVDHGKVLAYQLGKSGLKVNLQSYEWGTFYNDIKTGNFQLATMKWVGAFDPDIYRIAFHSRELSPGRNRSHYINKKLDALLDEAFRIEDFRKRKNAYMKIQKTVFDDFAIIPLWYDTQAVVLDRRLKGFETSALSDYYGLLNLRRGD